MISYLFVLSQGGPGRFRHPRNVWEAGRDNPVPMQLRRVMKMENQGNELKQLTKGCVMKKLLILSVLFAFLFSGMIYASETRVLTMGNANEIVKDPANVMLFPSTINYYPKLVGGELRSSSDYTSKQGDYQYLTDFYAHWVFGDKDKNPLTVGTYFYTNDDGIYWPLLMQSGHFGFDLTPPQFSYYDKRNSNDMPNRRITLVLGKKMGDIPVGLSINYISSKYEYTDTAATHKETGSLGRFAFLLS